MIGMQNSILNLMIDDGTDEVLRSAYTLMKFYDKYSKGKGVLYIASDSDIEGLRKLQKDEPTKVNVTFTQIPHQLANFVLENISIEFSFRGRNIGKSKAFPVVIKAQSVIEIPKFMTGEQVVLYKDIKWLRVAESIGFDFKDDYDRYAAIYVPNGLNMRSYNKIADRFKEKTRDLF